MAKGSPSEQVQQLTDPELVLRQYKDLMEYNMNDIQSLEDAYHHGESPAMGSILAGYLAKYSKDTDQYLKRLPVLLGMMESAFCELLANHNSRIIDMIQPSAPDDRR